MNAPLADAAQATGRAELASPRRILKDRDVLALVVGIVVGAGIFRTPALVAEVSGNGTLMLAAWVAGGVLSIIGALCYAELASAYPDLGGDLHFLRRAYGVRTAFLYGWARFSVIQTGSLALLAYVYGDYISTIVPLGPHSSAIHAALLVIVISGTNWLGVRVGAGVQAWLTVAEVMGLAAIIVAGLLMTPSAPTVPVEASSGLGGIGLVMVFVLLTYGGWNEAAYLSAEVEKSPGRLGRLMVIGLGLVTLLYLLVNIAFLRALGLSGMAEEDAVAAAVMGAAFGTTGATLISLIIAVAAVTSANATVMTGARSTCALARTVPALRWAGEWRQDRNTPGNAIIAQGIMALALVLAGVFAPDGFRLAVEYTAPVFWAFLLLVGVGLFILRRREPERPRPFRVPVYPVVPAIFCATSAYLLYSSLAYTGSGALVGVGVLALGLLFLIVLKPETKMEELDR
jgi:APA family basic amino acid/polyamine antiporter